MPAESLRSNVPLSETFAEEYLIYNQLLPISLEDGRLTVAFAGEPDEAVLEDLASVFNAELVMQSAPEDEILQAIRASFAASETVLELVRDLGQTFGTDEGGTVEGAPTDARAAASQPPVIRLVNMLLRDAHEAGASDIHLEAGPEGMRVRMRLDGVLHELPSPPRAMQAAIVSRLKLLAELDIAERRLPQDGRIRVRLETRELDLRVSTVPTLHGESVVLRLLDRGGRPVSLEELGMSPDTQSRFAAFARRPHGIVLVTGPTGSGKTSTLYAALGLRLLSEEKVITVEDPVEYHLAGVTQVPVQQKAGMSFATALRSLLRQDPDVLMVGEMRDRETAAVAVQAAMTGHLVLSTLHTNDSVSALVRLLDLGVEPYMVAATVEAVLAQRLVRRICDSCRSAYEPDPSLLSTLISRPVLAGSVHGPFERGTGCAACRHTGYRGRIGLFELLPVTDGVRDRMLRGPELTRLREVASEEGLTTLQTDGWSKVRAGITTVEEVCRVVHG